MGLIQRFVDSVNRVVEVVVVIAFAGLIANIAAAVFFRYVVNDSRVWAEELARYLFIWIVFLAAGLGVGRDIHIGLDFIPGLVGPKQRVLLQIAINIGIGVFLVILIVAGLQFAAFGMRARTMLLGVHMIYVYLAVPVGAAVMLLNLLPSTMRLLTGQGQDRGA